MTLSNYPEGVSGHEYEIAGGDDVVWSGPCANPECDFDGDVDAERYESTTWWECPECGWDNTDEYSGFDDDHDYDARKDRELEDADDYETYADNYEYIDYDNTYDEEN